jgi:NTE family protein
MENKVAQFINETGISQELEALKIELNKSNKRFSDVTDDQGNQYVDLVQQGGGVWGVALLGFVYVMEQVGIRFFSLAGTSAGAINAMAMASIKDKNETKTEEILELLIDLKMDALMDGKSERGFTFLERKLIGYFIKFPWFSKFIKYGVIILLCLLCISSIAYLFLNLNESSYRDIVWWISLSCWIITLLLLAITWRRLSQIKKGFGLNKGDYFHNWVTDKILKGKNLAELKAHFEKVPKGLKLDLTASYRNPKSEYEIAPKVPRLAFITADITTQNKIEFPRMWPLYYSKIEDVNPADFIRASMSIPVFFEAFQIPNKENEKDKKITDSKYSTLCRNVKNWEELLNWDKYRDIPNNVLFVDGGSLSNFPINIFYNPKNEAPRLPTFGIRLVEKKYDNNFIIKSLSNLAGKIIDTMKLSSDKEFINKNPSYDKGIAYVEIGKELSWLNFYMDDKQKQMLFKKGALEAIQFLKAFDWQKYKDERVLEKQKQSNTQKYNPNNW